MRIDEIDAFVAHGGERRGGLRRHGIGSQAIGHNQNEVALALSGRGHNLHKDADARGCEQLRVE
jgi:hypothetical protein